MTKQEKRTRIYEACELTELNRRHFSCNTIEIEFNKDVKDKYEMFLGSNWPWYTLPGYSAYINEDNCRSIRILAMLLFLETEPESLD